jgi:histidyl-tRNA synthetase
VSQLQPIKGTHDLMFEDIRRHRHVEETAFEVASRYGCGEIATPVLEFTDVFKRTLGDTSDIVTKEMYTFETKGGDSVTLRPEGTAGVARAFISGGLAQQTPLKFFYRGPMFRYERPQKGRQRQFHQIGAEILGVATPQADVEVIALAAHVLKELRLTENVTLEINSLGDFESRAAYREKLVKYFSARTDQLSADSRERLARNPLRILDSKDPVDKAAVEEAPLFTDHLNAVSKDFFQQVQDGLAALDIAFKVTPALVRGLDYYGHTAFEFTTDALGAQGTVLAGGRYDGLIKQMGGPVTPGIGWAAGVERLAMLLPELAPAKRPIAVIPMGDEENKAALFITNTLRHSGLSVDMAYSGNMGKRMTRANKIKAAFAVILGSDEVRDGVVTVRNLDTGDQAKVPQTDLARHLAAYK